MELVSINILCTNEKRFLDRCIGAILRQTYPEIEINFIDNNSSDGSAEWVRKHYQEVHVYENAQNLGYVGGHNLGFTISHGQYVMPLNADVFMKEDFIERAVEAMERDESIGMVQGKLLRISSVDEETPKRACIDSTGVYLTRSRRTGDLHFGEEDNGQCDREEFIFGPSGACPLFRRKMLEDIKIGEEYLDEDFFIYREEVDMAWRAQLMGWKCLYTPRAVAYHIRSYSPDKRKTQSSFFRRLQFRNRYLMLIKNDSWRNIARNLPFILPFEVAAFSYACLREPFLLRGYYEALKLMPKALKKRRHIMKKRRTSQKEMARWFR